MSPRTPSLLRWLRIAVAALVLFGGEDLHELLHRQNWSVPAGGNAASGQLELHAGACQFGQSTHELHCHACLLCKTAQAHDLLLPVDGTAWVSTGAAPAFVCDTTTCVSPLDLPGTLGARGPPVTSA